MADHSDMMPLGPSLASLSLLEKVVFFVVMLPALITQKLLSTVAGLIFSKATFAGTPWLEHPAPNIFTANGWMTWFPTFGLTMSIIKLRTRDGDDTDQLMLHGAIFFNEDIARQIEALGTVAFISVPSAFHDSFAMAWKERFPEAKVICCAAAHDEVSKGVAVEAHTEDALEPFDVTLHDPTPHLRVELGERVLEVPTGGIGECGEQTRALIFCDVLQNNPPLSCLFVALPFGWSGLRVARFYKFILVADRAGLQSFFVDMFRSVKNFELAVFAHSHEPVTGIRTPQILANAVAKHLSSAICY